MPPNDPFDQVMRLVAFRESRPGVSVEFRTAPAWHWEARWADENDDVHVVVRRELGELLDALEAE